MAELYQTVATVHDLVEGQGYPVEVDGRPIAVFLASGSYYAIDDTCPHQGAPLCDGAVVGKTVSCNWHGWRFSLENGSRVDAARGKIGTYPIRVVGAEIQVAVPQTESL